VEGKGKGCTRWGSAGGRAFKLLTLPATMAAWKGGAHRGRAAQSHDAGLGATTRTSAPAFEPVARVRGGTDRMNTGFVTDPVESGKMHAQTDLRAMHMHFWRISQVTSRKVTFSWVGHLRGWAMPDRIGQRKARCRCTIPLVGFNHTVSFAEGSAGRPAAKGQELMAIKSLGTYTYQTWHVRFSVPIAPLREEGRMREPPREGTNDNERGSTKG
jgi:hypothetical protein